MNVLLNDLTFSENIFRTFIKDNRYLFFIEGLGNTLILSFLAILIGILIGVTICFFKISDITIKIKKYKLKPLVWFANLYIDIIRGTPSVTQLLIIYFVIFGTSSLNPLIIGSIAFGINSGAYVAEIMRAGIMSIDHGQTEAGRSLGMTGFQTMRYIILPQAIKNILPALVNEFVVLIKETAIAGYIGIADLTKAARGVQSITFDYAYPLLGSAVIYYILIKILTLSMSALERRLRKSDTRTN